MLLWIGFAGLAALAVAALVRPLMRPADPGETAAAADLAVYRDQLAEIDAERERGLIAAEDAETARAEIARRLLSRAEAAPEAAGPGLPRAAAPRTVLAAVIAALVPFAGIAFYLAEGRPELPSQPFAARAKLPPEKQTVGQLVATVEQRLRTNPSDGEGWDVIAPVYMRLGRPADAQQAYARAIALLGESPKRLMGFGEAAMVVANGVVTDAARHAFERAAALQPDNPEPRLWLAFALEQEGKTEEARSAYQGLLSRFPGEAPWRRAVEERLQQLANPGAAGAARTAAGAEANGAQSGDRRAEIERMVEGLAARLKADGKDLSGWLRLVRSYVVLGRREDALAALGSARSQFAGDGRSLAEIDELAKGLGLGS
jgi:cytochrome c-type biogenesis protein CcmH